MQTSSLGSETEPIAWKPTMALAGVNAAITLSWISYRVHLAGLLTQAGFPASLAPLLLLIESALAIFIEPWAGSTSDRAPRRLGGRFYVIAIGAGLTALLFAILPGVFWLIQPSATANWWLPGLLIVWAIAISMFRSPALALLGEYATPKQLPLAASVVTLAGAVAGSATPLASAWLLKQGVTLTFIGSAILLLVTVGCLKATQVEPVTSEPAPSEAAAPFGWILRVFGLGLTVTLAFRLAIELFPKILKAAGMQQPLFLGVVFFSLAVGALLAGRLAIRWNNLRTMTVGLGLTAACLIVLTLIHHTSTAFLAALGLGIAFSLILNGTLPFALSLFPLQQAGLSVGLFFGGAAAASSLYSGFLINSGILTPVNSVVLAIVALLAAGCCLAGQASRLQAAS